MLDYSIPIPKDYKTPANRRGTLVKDRYKDKNLVIYVPHGYTSEREYPVFYFKMGTNNTAGQFWNYLGYTKDFNNVIDHLIENNEIQPCIIVSIDGNGAGNSKWLPENAYGLICYVEGKYQSYAMGDAAKIISSAPHRAIGGWSLGAIECRNILVDKPEIAKCFGWYDIQSGYNAKGMDKIDTLPFVGCVAGSADDPPCVTFTKTCMGYTTVDLAQIVKGYTHLITYQIAYFYNAIRFFFS